jgi:hypothetical protein
MPLTRSTKGASSRDWTLEALELGKPERGQSGLENGAKPRGIDGFHQVAVESRLDAA